MKVSLETTGETRRVMGDRVHEACCSALMVKVCGSVSVSQSVYWRTMGVVIPFTSLETLTL